MVLLTGLVPNVLFVVFSLLYISNGVFRTQEDEYRRAVLQSTAEAYDEALATWEAKLAQLDRYVRLLCDFRGYPSPFDPGFAPDLRTDWRLVTEIRDFLNRFVEENPDIQRVAFFNLGTEVGLDSVDGFIREPGAILPTEERGLIATPPSRRRIWTFIGGQADEEPQRLSLISFQGSGAARENLGFYYLEPSERYVRRPVEQKLEIRRSFRVVVDERGRIVAHTSVAELPPRISLDRLAAPFDPADFAHHVGYDFMHRSGAHAGWNHYLFYDPVDWVRRHFLPLFVMFLAANGLLFVVLVAGTIVARRIYQPFRLIRGSLSSDFGTTLPDAKTQEVREILHNVRRLRQDYRDEVQTRAALAERLKRVYPEARARLIARVLHGYDISPDMAEILDSLGLNERGSYRVIVFHVYRATPSDLDRLVSSVEESTATGALLFARLEPEKPELIAILNESSTTRDSTGHDGLVDAVRSIAGADKREVLVVRGEIGRGPAGIYHSYLFARSWLRAAFVLGPGIADSVSQVPGDFHWHRHRNEIFASLEAGDIEEVSRSLKSFAEEAKSCRLNDSRARFYCRTVLNHAANRLPAHHTDNVTLARSFERWIVEFEERFPYLEAFVDFLGDTLAGASERRDDRRYSVHAVKTLSHIHESYARNIGLNEIADRLRLSVPYLSRLFKEEVGESFKSYLTRFRIGKAKNLLQDGDLSIGDVADSVGYPNTGQFIRIFKKYEGLTPGDYRRRWTVFD